MQFILCNWIKKCKLALLFSEHTQQFWIVEPVCHWTRYLANIKSLISVNWPLNMTCSNGPVEAVVIAYLQTSNTAPSVVLYIFICIPAKTRRFLTQYHLCIFKYVNIINLLRKKPVYLDFHHISFVSWLD